MWSVDEVGRKGGGRDEKQQRFLQGRKGQRDVGGGKYRSVLVKVFVQRARVSVCICECNLEVLLIVHFRKNIILQALWQLFKQFVNLVLN